MVDKENIYTGSDPSSLTTQQILREVANLEKLLTQRIDSTDKAVGLAHNDLVRVPTDVDKAVGNLYQLLVEKLLTQSLVNEERLKGVEQRFVLTEQIRVAQNESNAISIAKSEAATAKQIDQLGVLIATTTKASDEKISDMKERMTRTESIVSGFQGIWAEIQNLKSGASTILGKEMGSKGTLGWIAFGISILWILFQAYNASKK